MKEVTEAKIATLINEYDIAVNRGKDAGVEEGDLVRIRKPTEIRDPDTSELLGTVYTTAGSFRVQTVLDKACLARVIDRIPSRSSTPFQTRPSPLKRVTVNPFEEEVGVLLVEIGQKVLIQREE